ncbi:MAG: hypothetical protein LCH54_14515 [Bacteroidetes bacterium]|nr:hypothetical protein [Bacteroidota bacterium]
MKKWISASLLLILSGVCFGQSQIQQPFDSGKKIFTLTPNSSGLAIWNLDSVNFDQFELFLNSDSTLFSELYIVENGKRIRSQRQVQFSEYQLNLQKMDSLLLSGVVGAETLTWESKSDLKFDFTLGHVGFVSAYHAWAIPYLVWDANNAGIYFLITGSSYFIVNQMAKNSRLTRENVTGSIEGHMNGIAQGLVTGFVLNDTETSFTLGTIGGLGHAFTSFHQFNKPGIKPIEAFLSTKTELYSLFWPGAFAGSFTEFSKSKARIIAGIGVVTSLTAPLWANSVFGFRNFNLTLSDAMLVEDFHLATVLTVLGANLAVNTSNGRIIAGTMGLSSVLGFYGGILNNQNQGFTPAETRLAKRFTYGGTLMGFGAFLLTENERLVALSVAAGTWLGYFAGKAYAHENDIASGGPEIRLMPENILLAGLFKSEKQGQQPVILPVCSVNWFF